MGRGYGDGSANLRNHAFTAGKLLIVRRKDLCPCIFPYELGEMKGETGEVLRYEVEAAASDMAIKIEALLREYPLYKKILQKTGSPKTSLYYQKVIKAEIYSATRDLCVRQWHRRNNVKVEGECDCVSVPSAGVSVLLEKMWPDRDIPLRIIRKVSVRQRIASLYSSFRSLARRSVDGFWAIYSRHRYSEELRNISSGKGMIALQYVEGIDSNRRSDLVWYPGSGIDPERMLLYFYWPDHKPVDDDVIKSIEDMGMKWVCLNRRASKSKNAPAWYPPFGGKKILDGLDAEPQDKIEKWIYRTGKKLFDEVNYWSAFYDAFNVKIHFIIGGGDTKYISQSIAFGLNGSDEGFVVTKQRSELHWPSLSILGSYPIDVFFTWSPRAEQYLSPNVNRIITSVSTGYPNDFVFNQKRRDAKQAKDSLRSHGVDFTIALFDNVHGPDIGYSTAKMERFYLEFLGWLLEDPGVGILIKSKKPSVLQKLPKVLPVLVKAEATGRCIRIGNEFGRLPADASLASDISVGIGVSSAVIEAAIAGCRSVHCDLSYLRFHEFYQWGYERLIFDDLDRLVTAMKAYKAGDRNSAELGDWTPFLDKLDPFRDGRSGERMGTYLRWCLDSFDSGLDRDEAIHRANEKHNARWGADKTAFLPHFS